MPGRRVKTAAGVVEICGSRGDGDVAAASWSIVRIVIEGYDLPGARFCSDGAVLANVHVAVQVGKDPVDPIRADAASARWELEVRAVVEDTTVALRGPAVHGKKGERFLYLTWGDVGGDGSFVMFRRAKLMVSDVDPDLLRATASSDGTLVASLSLTDGHGGPRCARVRAARGQLTGRGFTRHVSAMQRHSRRR